MAVNTLVGQSLGAKDTSKVIEVIRKGTLYAVAFMLLLGILGVFFAQNLVSIFISNDPTVISEATILVQLSVGTLFLLSSNVVIVAAYRGAGKTKTAFLLSAIYVILQIVSAIILMQFFGLFGLWLSSPVSALLVMIFSQIYLRYNPIKEGII